MYDRETRIYRCVEAPPSLGSNHELPSVLVVEQWAEDAMGTSRWEVVPCGTMRTYVLEEAVLRPPGDWPSRPARMADMAPEGEYVPQGPVGYGG
jgi:hypothetical protein